MKEQSERSFIAIQKQLTLDQLIELSHYRTLFKYGSQQQLGISDYDINLHESPEYYVKRRRGVKVEVQSPIDKISKNQDQGKTSKKLKVESIKKSVQTQNKINKLTDKDLPEIKINYIASKAPSVKSQPDKAQVKSSKRKIQQVPPKKQQKQQFIEKVSSFSLKQFQKPYIEHFYNKKSEQTKVIQTQKINLSDFMKSSKKQIIKKPIQHISNTSKIPKTQKASPINKKQRSSDRSEVSSQKKSIYQSPIVSYNKAPLIQSKLQFILPENYVSPNSKSKSKNKIKKPKQTSFAKKSPLKTFNKSLVHSYIIQPQRSQKKNQDNPVFPTKIQQTPKNHHYNRPHRKINLKREDISPTQDFYDQPLSPQNGEYNHQSDIDQFQQNKSTYSRLQRQVKQTKNGQKIQYQYNKMDYFQIDIGPLNKQGKKLQQQSQRHPQINQVIKSKQQSVKPIQKIKQSFDKTSKSSQHDNPTKVPKTPRKKIFQEASIKSIPQRSEQSDQLLLSSLNDQEMKLLLGAKGNKYKQAIILQYIKQNRKNNA